IDFYRVEAQQARRILDRLVGYELSPLLWDKIRKGLSAGRVQSVALRLICEREEEIENFVPQEYWYIWGEFEILSNKERIIARLISYKGEKIDLNNEDEVKKILKELEKYHYKIDNIVLKEEKKNAPLPFITSTLQQEASRRFGFSVSKTMKIAQSLYEGVDIGEDRIGLITYMRTDSTRIAPEARAEALEYIEKMFGKEYIGKEKKERKRLGVQDAHEAIRPTSLYREPDKIKNYLTEDQYRIYKLIWERFIASQMAPALYDVVEIYIKGKDYVFLSKGKKLKFLGFMSLYFEKEDEEDNESEINYIPDKDELIKLVKLEPKQYFTQPPPRYTEATLVRTLEKYGIGRPSTYATIIETLKERKYVEIKDKALVPTTLGKVVNEFLIKQFPQFIDVKFTAKMEEDLDRIEHGEVKAIEILKKFYPDFKKEIEKVFKNSGKVQVAERTDEVCPQCGSKLVIRENKNGKYYACSRYPECRYTRPIYEEAKGKCPFCGNIVVKKRSKKNGKTFWGCINYPKCNFASPYEPLDEKCPKCGSILLKSSSFKKCSSESCDYILWTKRRNKRWKK
ncbi:MAG: type I DNA topoisomerase, partial [Dictyoglomus sp.]